MAKKPPISQQAHALTPEQTALAPKLHRNRILIPLALVLVLAAVVLYALLSCRQAEQYLTEMELLSDQNVAAGTVDPAVIAERQWASDNLDHALQRKTILLWVGGGCGLAGLILYFIYFKLSYPWYSERLYRYLRFHK